jgi:hypothetical protein
MARLKKGGVHSWEDVLAQRYQSTSVGWHSRPAKAINHSTRNGIRLINVFSDDKPSSLPRYRRRKGNIRGPAPRGLDISQTPDQQPQCLLLQTLPPELRLVIWEMVLGGLRLHIIQRSKRRLGCVICPRKDTCDICRGVLQQPVKSAETHSNVNLISLLVTCKQM